MAAWLRILIAGASGVGLSWSPRHGPSLSLCTCDACGSEHLISALWTSITGAPSPPRVPDPADTPISVGAPPGNASLAFSEATPGTQAYIVVADPAERYLALFHRYAACCPARAPQQRMPCMHGDRPRTFLELRYVVPLPLRRTMATVPCLHLDEYAQAIEMLSSLPISAVRRITPHFQPQHSLCSTRGKDTLIGTAETVSAALRAQAHPGFVRPLSVAVPAGSAPRARLRPQALNASMRRLCAASAAELATFATPLSTMASTSVCAAHHRWDVELRRRRR